MEVDDGGRPIDSVSSNSLAGSAERIELYARRWQSGLAIFNPMDSKDIQAPFALKGRRQRELEQSGIRQVVVS